jgi:hypothetical protein
MKYFKVSPCHCAIFPQTSYISLSEQFIYITTMPLSHLIITDSISFHINISPIASPESVLAVDGLLAFKKF